MSTPPKRRDVSISRTARVEVYLSGEELATITGISFTTVQHLVQVGVLEPAAPGTSEFTAATAARLRRMLRLHADLDVNIAGAAVIVELLERLERLERELARMRGGDAEEEGRT